MFYFICFDVANNSIGKEPEVRKLPGLTPSIQPEAMGLETNVKTGLDLEYEKEGEQYFP